MYKPLNTKKGLKTSEKIGIGALILIVLAIIFGSSYYFLFHEEKQFDKGNTLCPVVKGVVEPTNIVAILIDETDPLTPNQKDFLNVEVEKLIRNQAEGTLISLYSISNNTPVQRTPSFNLCKVRDGSDADKLTENEALMRKRFKNEFEKPLRAQLEKLNEINTPSKESKLFEEIQAISINTFQKYNTKGTKELYIFSDMLHNTKDFTLYKTRQNFDELKKSGYFAGMRSNLIGVDVNMYYFINQPRFQKNQNVNFWKDFFNELGASVVKVEVIGK